MFAGLCHSRSRPQCGGPPLQCSCVRVGGYLHDGSSHWGVSGHLVTAGQCRAAASVFTGTFITALVVRPPATVVDETPGSGTRRVTAAALRASDHCGRTVTSVIDLVPAWANFGVLLRGGCLELLAAGPDLTWWLV
ncbi:hypothetical protein MRX96_017024 [Rhipicephalus microplus]